MKTSNLRAVKDCIRVGALVAAGALSLSVAIAQPYSAIANCNYEANTQPGTGCTTCDSMRDALEHACEANGGHLPGDASYDAAIQRRQPY